MQESIHDAREYGWEAPEELDHDWSKLQAGISDYIGGLNWGYRVKLREEGITYKNAMGRLLDAHTVETTDKKDRKKTYTGKNILVRWSLLRAHHCTLASLATLLLHRLFFFFFPDCCGRPSVAS